MEKLKSFNKYFFSLILILLSITMLIGCKKKDDSIKGFEKQVDTIISANFYVKMKQLTSSSENEIIREFTRDNNNMIQVVTAKNIETGEIINQERIMYKDGYRYDFNYNAKTYIMTPAGSTDTYIYSYDDKMEGSGYQLNGNTYYCINYASSLRSRAYFYKSGDRVKYFREVYPNSSGGQTDITYEVLTITSKIPQSAGFSYDIPKGYTKQG